MRRHRLPIRLIAILTGLALGSLVSPAQQLTPQESQVLETSARPIPPTAKQLDAPETKGGTLWRDGNSLYLQLDRAAGEGTAEIPRVAAPLRRMDWLRPSEASGESSAKESLSITPEQSYWIIRWSGQVTGAKTIRMEFAGQPHLMHELEPVSASIDESFYLPAHLATTDGEKVRYEPQSFKNTVGYWTGKQDLATWTLQLIEPGRFNVAILQGCGAGQGGSQALLELRRVENEAAEQGERVGAAAAIDFEVLETGHFQNFQWRHLADVELTAPGRYEVRLSPIVIQRAALMDVRAIHLIRVPN